MLVETIYLRLLKWNTLDYKIMFVESISFNYNGISKFLLMTSLVFPTSLLGVQLWLIFLGAQSVDEALGTGDAEVSPVILSDFQTSEKGETNLLSTAILSTVIMCMLFGGGSEK